MLMRSVLGMRIVMDKNFRSISQAMKISFHSVGMIRLRASTVRQNKYSRRALSALLMVLSLN